MHTKFSSGHPKTRDGLKSRKIDALQDRKCTYNLTTRCVHVAIVAVGKKKTVGIEYCESVRRLTTQHAKRMRSTVSSSLASLTVSCFSTLPRKARDFRKKKVIDHKMRVLNFSTIYAPNTSHPKKNSERHYLKV